MLLNNFKTLLLLISISGAASAQNSFSDSYKPGDKLYVYSRDGLSLREDADAKGKLVVVASYGDEIIVAPDSKPRVSFTSSNIPGAWVKVNHKGKTGYMFNGFLSRTKPMSLTTADKELDALEVFFKNHFTLLRETKAPPETYLVEYLRLDFANEVTYEHKIYEGGASIITKFPIKYFTFQEVFLLARIAYPEFFSEKKCDYKTDNIECNLDDLSSLQIKKDGTFIVLISGSAD
jgi:hypothetical protein